MVIRLLDDHYLLPCCVLVLPEPQSLQYHTSNVQRYDRVQTRHSKMITDRKNTEEEEDAGTATRKETQTVKNDPAVV